MYLWSFAFRKLTFTCCSLSLDKYKKLRDLVLSPLRKVSTIPRNRNVNNYTGFRQTNWKYQLEAFDNNLTPVNIVYILVGNIS